MYIENEEIEIIVTERVTFELSMTKNRDARFNSCWTVVSIKRQQKTEEKWKEGRFLQKSCTTFFDTYCLSIRIRMYIHMYLYTYIRVFLWLRIINVDREVTNNWGETRRGTDRSCSCRVIVERRGRMLHSINLTFHLKHMNEKEKER